VDGLPPLRGPGVEFFLDGNELFLGLLTENILSSATRTAR
jgi:hypothetical protein